MAQRSIYSPLGSTRSPESEVGRAPNAEGRQLWYGLFGSIEPTGGGAVIDTDLPLLMWPLIDMGYIVDSEKSNVINVAIGWSPAITLDNNQSWVVVEGRTVNLRLRNRACAKIDIPSAYRENEDIKVFYSVHTLSICDTANF